MVTKMGGLRALLVAGVIAGFAGGAISSVEAAESVTVPAFPDFQFENVLTVPSGEVSGVAVKSDGVTPYEDMKIALLDSETGEEVVASATDGKGAFVFEDVAEGRYVLQFGNPGITAVVDVSSEVSAGTLNVVIPEPSVLPVPDWAPAWAQNTPGLLYAAGGVGIGAAGVAIYRRSTSPSDRERVLSPIMP